MDKGYSYEPYAPPKSSESRKVSTAMSRFHNRSSIRSALAAASAAALAAGLAAPAQAQETDLEVTEPQCILVTNYQERLICANTMPTDPEPGMSLGYGSLGTGSIADLSSEVANQGSLVMSLYIPGSLDQMGSTSPQSTAHSGDFLPLGSLVETSAGALS